MTLGGYDAKRATATAVAGLAGVLVALFVQQRCQAPGASDVEPAAPSAPPPAAHSTERSGALAGAPAPTAPAPSATDEGTPSSSSPSEASPPIANASPAAASAPAPSSSSGGVAGNTPAPPHAAKPLGSLSKEVIREAVRRATPLIKDCYEQGLKRDPSLAGRVVVEFEIGAQDGKGKVTSGSVAEAETESPFFEACVLEKVTGIEVDAPEGGGVVKVRYPFQFDPGGGFGGEEGDKE